MSQRDVAPVRAWGSVMVQTPLCPIVLSLLVARPRAAHEVAAELAERGLSCGGQAVTRETLRRLQDARLVRRRVCGRGEPLFAATARGRRELVLGRLLVRRLGRAAF